MSYDIIYNKQLVKLRRTGEVIVMLLAGSNNCYEIGRGGRTGRRSRSWDSFRYYNRKGKISEKPERILKALDADLRKCIRNHRGDKEATPTDIRNRWGYYTSLVVGSGHCGGTSWPMWYNLFATAIKKAKTIEELDELGVNLSFGYFSMNGEDGMPPSIAIRTEREYFIELKKWREWQEGKKGNFHLAFSPHDTDAVLRRLRSATRREPREKVSVEQDHYFTMTDGHYALLKYTRNGYRYSWSKTGGKRFMTEKEAETYRKQLVDKGRYKADIWQVERIEAKMTFYR